jgi:hypothetical protein
MIHNKEKTSLSRFPSPSPSLPLPLSPSFLGGEVWAKKKKKRANKGREEKI